MKRRKSMSRKGSRKNFKRNTKPHRKNFSVKLTRGGGRL